MAQSDIDIDSIQHTSSLDEIQKYMQLVSIQRGFTRQSSRDTLLVLVEEVGELAKAIRKDGGIGIDHQRLDS